VLREQECRMNAHRAYLFSRTLQAIRESRRKAVPSHRASRHVGIDIIQITIVRHGGSSATGAMFWEAVVVGEACENPAGIEVPCMELGLVLGDRMIVFEERVVILRQ
jgi:hypothetical protein